MFRHLKAKFVEYKRATLLFYRKEAHNHSADEVHTHLTSINTGEYQTEFKYNIDVANSFTFLDWRIAQMIRDGELDIDQINDFRL